MSNIDNLEQALEHLVNDTSPRAEVAGLDEHEQRMVRMAQLIRGSAPQQPRAEFVQALHSQVSAGGPRVSRRTAFLSGVATLAAGILAGFGIDRWAHQASSSTAGKGPVVGNGHGQWIQVALVDQVPDGAVRPFSAGSVQGFLIHRNGRLRAMSRICTHMGCALHYKAAESDFVCPCHGARFDLLGAMVPQESYSISLPPLPSIDVRVRDQSIEVRGV